MSIQAVAWALDQDIADAAAKLILISLANAMNGKTGRCFPTIEQICKESSCSKSTVLRKLKWLENEEWIAINAEFADDGRQLANSYTLGFQNDTGRVSHRHGEGFNSDTLGGVNCDTPIKEPEEIPEVSSSSASASMVGDDLDHLRSKLLAAVGEKIQPHGSIVLGPILGLLNGGCDLETDILPTIKAVSARAPHPAGSWSYFVKPIQQAFNDRIKAGQGLAKPVCAVTPDTELAPDALEAEWEKRLKYARRNSNWISAVWGPMPGDDGCRVPNNLLQPTDGKDRYGVRWDDQSRRAA
ncbi:helix-turn-helix domain-containing protein [Brucella tritici]|uniref:helix-turn-helix domain-containing protein n=1 Tax=Brucella tritici TaxID=94626 RepID=UPI0020018FC2|nr:helix-turn-helix domain-containing protein [Brucella tritici]